MKQQILEVLSDGAAWRFRDLTRKLAADAGESEVYAALKRLLREGSVKRVRHGVYIRSGTYDWTAHLSAPAESPVVRNAILSLLTQPRTPDEIATMLEIRVPVVWQNIRRLVQSGEIRPTDAQGLHAQPHFVSADAPIQHGAGGGTNEELADRILGMIADGRVYSAHALAAHAGMSTKLAKQMVGELALQGKLRAFTVDDGLFFWPRSGSPTPRLGVLPLKPVNILAELGVGSAELLSIIGRSSPASAIRLGAAYSSVMNGGKHSVARLLTKLRRAGLIYPITEADQQLWTLTDAGRDIEEAIWTGKTPLTPIVSDVMLGPAEQAERQPSVIALAAFLIQSAESMNTSDRLVLPVNKRILCKSLNITISHLNRCIRTLAPFGVTFYGGRFTVDNYRRLAELIAE